MPTGARQQLKGTMLGVAPPSLGAQAPPAGAAPAPAPGAPPGFGAPPPGPAPQGAPGGFPGNAVNPLGGTMVADPKTLSDVTVGHEPRKSVAEHANAIELDQRLFVWEVGNRGIVAVGVS
jgi:hypothetical protein